MDLLLLDFGEGRVPSRSSPSSTARTACTATLSSRSPAPAALCIEVRRHRGLICPWFCEVNLWEKGCIVRATVTYKRSSASFLMRKSALLLLCGLSGASAFLAAPAGPAFGTRLQVRGASGVSALRAAVQVEKDVDAVGVALCGFVAKAAKEAIDERGYFALAIPGGSILKMLSFMDHSTVDWSKTVMAYVNHRAVPNDDETATHKKAGPLFLNEWEKRGCSVVTLSGSRDAAVEASKYQESLKKISSEQLPVANGLPQFDLTLIGVGLDGHIGSLYPDCPEVDMTSAWVLPVKEKSITLSLPVMKASKQVVVASAGKSEKYPMGKAEAMVRALEADETPSSFPAMALRDQATWILDEGAAAMLKPAVTK